MSKENAGITLKLYFVRHGESDANRLHVISNRGNRYGLTPTGHQQAQTLAEKLKPVPISAIFTSPLCRAVETAKILSQTLELPYQITDALREYDCGILEGLTNIDCAFVSAQGINHTDCIIAELQSGGFRCL